MKSATTSRRRKSTAEAPVIAKMTAALLAIDSLQQALHDVLEYREEAEGCHEEDNDMWKDLAALSGVIDMYESSLQGNLSGDFDHAYGVATRDPLYCVIDLQRQGKAVPAKLQAEADADIRRVARTLN